MRVLAHIHTFNDADVIDQAIEALHRQTRPVDGILIVDNASIDGTLERPCVKHATVLCHRENLGTSGAVFSGFRFALEQDYDWIWLFDADSTPEPDALERLLELHAGWPPDLQDEIGFLACLPRDVEQGVPFRGGVFTRDGVAFSEAVPLARHYPCHFNFWSGCLYRLSAVHRIGLPNRDYMLDWGETEYGYRLMKAGYKGFMHQDAILHHNIRGYRSLTPTEVKGEADEAPAFGYPPSGLAYPPIRCYYSCRNILYFALYEFREGGFGALCRIASRALRLTLYFLRKPRNHSKQRAACFRGLWHGLTGNITARY